MPTNPIESLCSHEGVASEAADGDCNRLLRVLSFMYTLPAVAADDDDAGSTGADGRSVGLQERGVHAVSGITSPACGESKEMSQVNTGHETKIGGGRGKAAQQPWPRAAGK